MQIQRVFRAGNSDVVAIPKNLLKDLGIKTGQRVTLEKTLQGDALVVKKVVRAKSRATKKEVDMEFKKWWEVFIKENGETLDELAVR